MNLKIIIKVGLGVFRANDLQNQYHITSINFKTGLKWYPSNTVGTKGITTVYRYTEYCGILTIITLCIELFEP